MYVPSARKIKSPYDVFSYETFSILLAYTSRPYSESMAMLPSVTYTPYATSSIEQTGNIITFAHFEGVNILSETHNNAEISEESDEDSMIPPLPSKEEMDTMGSVNESYHDPISTEMLEDIYDGSQSHPSVKRKEAHASVCDVYTLCYVFDRTNWQYNHVCTF